MNFSETLSRDKDVTKLIWLEDDLFNEDNEFYCKSNSIIFNSYAQDDCKLLSNHAPCIIKANGMTFNSVEQIYFYMRFYNHSNVQNDIMKMNNPSEIKNICNRHYLELYPDVKLQKTGFKTNLLLFAQRLKLQQNPKVAKVITDRLIKHRTYEIIPQIVEYTWWNDTVNGTIDTMPELKGDFKNGTVKGQNRSGRMLRRCYQELRVGLLDNEIKPPYDFLF